jgi:uncharacterized protein YuzB (UPF0349 family)
VEEYFSLYKALEQAVGSYEQHHLLGFIGTILKDVSLDAGEFDCKHQHSVCKEVLDVLRKTCSNSLYFSSKGPINLTNLFMPSIDILDSLDEEEIAKMCSDTYIEKVLSTVFQIIEGKMLSSETAEALKRNIPNFQERFEQWKEREKAQ